MISYCDFFFFFLIIFFFKEWYMILPRQVQKCVKQQTGVGGDVGDPTEERGVGRRLDPSPLTPDCNGELGSASLSRSPASPSSPVHMLQH